jgi:hypothetical protein
MASFGDPIITKNIIPIIKVMSRVAPQLWNVARPPAVFLGVRYRRSLAMGNGKKEGSNDFSDSDKSLSKASGPREADAVTGNPNEDLPAPWER